MQYSIKNYQIQSKDLVQVYKNAQQYVIDSAQGTKQKMVNGARFLTNLISTYAFQIYSYVQNASHRLLPSRVSIINLKALEVKPPIQKPVDYSVIPSALGENHTTNIDKPNIDWIKNEMDPKIVPSDSAPLASTPNDSIDIYKAGFLMTAFLAGWVAAKPFKGHPTPTKSERFLLEGATISQKLLPEPSSGPVIPLPAPHKLPSNIKAFRQPEIRKANLEQGVEIMRNLFKSHGESPVTWKTIIEELKPVRQKQIYTSEVLKQFDVEKSVKGVLLRTLKPRI